MVKQIELEIVDQPFRAQGFAGHVGRALLLAAAALRTGIEVQNVFPVQISHVAQTESFGIFIFNIGFDHRLGPIQRFQKYVRNRRKQMQVFRTRDVHQEAQDSQQMNPVGDFITGPAACRG